PTGHIDPAKARVFDPHLTNLPAEHVETICAALLPKARGWTTGQLAARLTRMVIAIDPDRARDQYQRAVTERRVIAYLTPEGTVTLTAEGLAPDEAAAAYQCLHQLAARIKHAGHPARLDQIKADVMLGLLERRFDGLTAD